MLNILIMIGLLIIGFLVSIHFLFVIVTVKGVSMLPSLEDGDKILALRLFPKKFLKINQIIIIKQPNCLPYMKYEAINNLAIKRIKGLPGKKIYMTPFVFSSQTNNGITDTWLIPRKHVFVCGDNSNRSVDSRYWGAIPMEFIKGVMLLKLSGKVKHEYKL